MEINLDDVEKGDVLLENRGVASSLLTEIEVIGDIFFNRIFTFLGRRVGKGNQRNILVHENFHVALSVISIGDICSSANRPVHAGFRGTEDARSNRQRPGFHRVVTTRGRRKLFQQWLLETSPSTRWVGYASDTYTRHKTPQPSRRAASSSSLGIDLNAWHSRKMPK